MKKIVLILLAVFYSAVGFAQFTDEVDSPARLFIQLHEKTRFSLIDTYRFSFEGESNITIQNIITNNLTFDVTLGLWYGNDVNSEVGVDIALGVTYTPVTSYYLFGEIHPRLHMRHETITHTTIGDATSVYGYFSFGCGYALKLNDVFYLYTEGGFDFNVSTRLFSSNNAMLINDVQLFFTVGLLARNI